MTLGVERATSLASCFIRFICGETLMIEARLLRPMVARFDGDRGDYRLAVGQGERGRGEAVIARQVERERRVKTRPGAIPTAGDPPQQPRRGGEKEDGADGRFVVLHGQGDGPAARGRGDN